MIFCLNFRGVDSLAYVGVLGCLIVHNCLYVNMLLPLTQGPAVPTDNRVTGCHFLRTFQWPPLAGPTCEITPSSCIGSVAFVFQKWCSHMNGRDASLDRICIASGDMKILNTETRTLNSVNGYPWLKPQRRICSIFNLLRALLFLFESLSQGRSVARDWTEPPCRESCMASSKT